MNKQPYKPNAVPLEERVVNTILGLILMAYGLIGFFTSQIDLQGRKIRIAVFHGAPAWLLAIALLIGAAVLLSVVVDHYDTRNNERYYQAFRWGATRLGWWFAASALVSHLVMGFAA